MTKPKIMPAVAFALIAVFAPAQVKAAGTPAQKCAAAVHKTVIKGIGAESKCVDKALIESTDPAACYGIAMAAVTKKFDEGSDDPFSGAGCLFNTDPRAGSTAADMNIGYAGKNAMSVTIRGILAELRRSAPTIPNTAPTQCIDVEGTLSTVDLDGECARAVIANPQTRVAAGAWDGIYVSISGAALMDAVNGEQEVRDVCCP